LVHCATLRAAIRDASERIELWQETE
jgi:hypothetical protein